MSGSGRTVCPPTRGRGISRGRAARGEQGDDFSRARPGRTRPYRRSSSGRGSSTARKQTSSSTREDAREKTSASQQVLARAAAIRESASQFARDAREYSSDSASDGEEAEGREVIKNMLKIYYQDLASDGTVPLAFSVRCRVQRSPIARRLCEG